MLKAFEKHQKLRNLTCSYIALKPIQVSSKIKLANISDKTSSLSCHMFLWQRLDLNNRQNFSTMVGHFKVMQTQGKKKSV